MEKKSTKRKEISITHKIKEELSRLVKDENGNYVNKFTIIARKIVNEVEKGDKDMLKMLWNYIDGLPKNKIGLEADFNIDEVKIEIISKENKEDKEENKENENKSN